MTFNSYEFILRKVLLNYASTFGIGKQEVIELAKRLSVKHVSEANNFNLMYQAIQTIQGEGSLTDEEATTKECRNQDHVTASA